MTYTQAMQFIEDSKRWGSRPGLDSIRCLMKELGDPQERLSIVHIAGTNGKGSIGAMIAAAFAAAGIRCGHFSSPDVFRYEDQFRINGEWIGMEALSEMIGEIASACARMTARGMVHPTRFEIETAIAFLWFYKEGCEVCVIEAGMGGTEDATNLIAHPLISVIAPVGLEHQHFLGKTMTEIAQAKAGIIKPGCPVVSALQTEEVLSVIRRNAKEQGCNLFSVCPADIPAAELTPKGSRFELDFSGEKTQIFLDLAGAFQIENAVCAKAVLDIAAQWYPALSAEAVRESWAKLCWPGRLEHIGAKPDFYIDGAHNPHAAARLRESLNLCFTDRKITYIMGVLADKDFEEMARIMFQPEDAVYTVTPENPRARDGRELAKHLCALGYHARFCESLEEALRRTKTADMVLAFGSLSYLKQIRDKVCGTAENS